MAAEAEGGRKAEAGSGAGPDPAALAAAAAENRFRLAWSRGPGRRRHAEMPLRPRRPGAAPACAAAPRIVPLPLQHSPAPCALASVQGAGDEAGDRIVDKERMR